MIEYIEDEQTPRGEWPFDDETPDGKIWDRCAVCGKAVARGAYGDFLCLRCGALHEYDEGTNLSLNAEQLSMLRSVWVVPESVEYRGRTIPVGGG